MAKKKTPRLSDQIRRLIRNSGVSRYAISKATGIDQGTLSHFMAGRRGLSMDSLDKLAEFLSFVVVRKGPSMAR